MNSEITGNKQPLSHPSPLQDLTGIEFVVRSVPEKVFDHVLDRDAKIFEQLAKV